ncbi:Dehydrogenase [Lachnellula willkommii]|uniref:Dehydrogenase n=1 Tax=Lachnellula willkommii TaxID=215461 RepID=A0A559MEM6_9HELO|nr:Dehydrogenase [Lachnellula willkommii]
MAQNPLSGLPTGAIASLSSIGPATKERSYATTAYYTPVAHRQNLHVLPNCDVQRILLERTDDGFRATNVKGPLLAVKYSPTAASMILGSSLTKRSSVASYAYLPMMETVSGNGKISLDEILDGDEPNNSAAPPRKIYRELVNNNLKSKDKASSAFLAVAAQNVVPIDRGKFSCGKSPIQFGLHRKEGILIKFVLVQCSPSHSPTVHILSPDPNTKPSIDPKSLSHPLDLEILARHVSYLPNIAEAEPFKSSIMRSGGRRRDPKSLFKNLDNAKNYIRTSGVSMWHRTSTCSMLPRDKGGVINERLLVHGTSNLRIVDASIMPLMPISNIQSRVYAVAERAAEIIKADNGLNN